MVQHFISDGMHQLREDAAADVGNKPEFKRILLPGHKTLACSLLQWSRLD